MARRGSGCGDVAQLLSVCLMFTKLWAPSQALHEPGMVKQARNHNTRGTDRKMRTRSFWDTWRVWGHVETQNRSFLKIKPSKIFSKFPILKIIFLTTHNMLCVTYILYMCIVCIQCHLTLLIGFFSNGQKHRGWQELGDRFKLIRQLSNQSGR